MAFTVSGNSSSTATLLKMGEKSHQTRATAGMATAIAIANAIVLMVLRLRVDVARRMICIAHPQAIKTRNLHFSFVIRRYVSCSTQSG